MILEESILIFKELRVMELLITRTIFLEYRLSFGMSVCAPC
jgi:hypothetical protein